MKVGSHEGENEPGLKKGTHGASVPTAVQKVVIQFSEERGQEISHSSIISDELG